MQGMGQRAGIESPQILLGTTGTLTTSCKLYCVRRRKVLSGRSACSPSLSPFRHPLSFPLSLISPLTTVPSPQTTLFEDTTLARSPAHLLGSSSPSHTYTHHQKYSSCRTFTTMKVAIFLCAIIGMLSAIVAEAHIQRRSASSTVDAGSIYAQRIAARQYKYRPRKLVTRQDGVCPAPLPVPSARAPSCGNSGCSYCGAKIAMRALWAALGLTTFVRNRWSLR